MSPLAELRLQAAHQAEEAGDLPLAVAEAEELLDEQPDHQEALQVVAEASLQMGQPAVAAAALDQLARLRESDAPTWSLLSLARLEACDLEGAIGAAARAEHLDASVPMAWYFHGLALCFLGNPDEGMALMRHSRDLAGEDDPPPLPLDLTDAEWEDALRKARRLLPAPLKRFWEGVPSILRAWPDLTLLQSVVPARSPRSLVFVQGQPPEGDDGDPWHQRPDAVVLFQRNLELAAHGERSHLPQTLGEVLRLEALDWLDLHPDDYPLRGT